MQKKGGANHMIETKISLKAARVNANLTQEAAASFIDVKKETISRWEKGKGEPKISQAIALCSLYGVPLDNVIFLPS